MNKNWFTRKHQESIDSVYLSNMIRATEYFTSWFKRYFDTSYERMLKRMHHMACANGYRGCTGGSLGRVDDEWRQFSCGDVMLDKKWYTGVQTSYDPMIIKPVVKTMPKMARHWLRDTGNFYELNLPDEMFISWYIEQLSTLMDDLKRDLDPVLLAGYMHLFIIAHPFEKVNFSICMAQVNAILDMNGYETLYHEYMDFACFLYDSDIIEKMFVSRLSKKSN